MLQEAVNKTPVYEWYSHFKGGEMSCEDQQSSGRTSTCRNDENLEKVRNTMNADRCQTIDEFSEITGLSLSSCQRMLTEDLNMSSCQRMLTEDLNMSSCQQMLTEDLNMSSCQRMLTEDLNMKCVSTKFIPRLLTQDQKNNCLNVCYDRRVQVGNDPHSFESCDQR